MAEKTAIAWTDSTFNLWRGCTKVSEGCANCYAETLSHRNPATLGEWGPGKPRVHAAKSYAREPLKWEAEAVKRQADYLAAAGDSLRLAYLEQKHPTGNRHTRVFASSLSDILDTDGVPIEWFVELLALVYRTPNLDWLCLTKRPESFYDRIKSAWAWHTNQPAYDQFFADFLYAWGKQGRAPANVWFGVSGENNKRLWNRWGFAKLVKAKVHFLSLEPLLEDVADTLATIIAEARTLNIKLWVIVGGESGADARPFNVAWARRIVRLCANTGTACFIKQLGAAAVEPDPVHDYRPYPSKDKKGGDMAEWPPDIRVREFPADRYKM
jgi:protein gp37